MHYLQTGLLCLALLGAATAAESAVTATVVGSTLRVVGDGTSDAIILRLHPGDPSRLHVVVGPTIVGIFARATFDTIAVDAGGGDDSVLVDEIFGAFTDLEFTTIDGGSGNDRLTGGLGAETILGGSGTDQIWGEGGNDSIRGGDGDDQFVWMSGDGSDTIDGEAGSDLLAFHPSGASEVVSVSAVGARAVVTCDIGSISLNVGTTEGMFSYLGGGNDTFTVGAGLQVLTTLQVDGGPGNDTIVGGAGDDTLQGGDGGDTIDGGPGNDSISPGPGNDVVHGGPGGDQVTWTAGDGNDTFDGDDGADSFSMTGNSAAENIAVSVVAGRIHITRDVGAAVQDLGSVERLGIGTLGGDDTVTIPPGLDALVTNVSVDLGDGADTLWTTTTSGLVSVNGRPGGPDTLNVDARARVLDVRPYAVFCAGSWVLSIVEMENVAYTNTVGTLPTVTITSPTSAPTTTANASFIGLAGIASDAEGVSDVTWFDARGNGTATGTTTWSVEDVPLEGGLNYVTVTVRDFDGNQTADTITITVPSITYTLAEGATGPFFDLDVSIANPNASAASATVTFLKQDGTTVVQDITLESMTRRTLHVDGIAGLEDAGGVSTVVTSTSGKPLIVERTMFWDASYYGSHGGTAVDGPRTRWLFAEGSEGYFSTFVLLANAAVTPSTVTLTFLREGTTPFVRTVTVPPTSRVTVAAGSIPELVNRSFSIVVDATSPIVAERSMYFGTARVFDGGHESAGVSEGATSWFLAEGATGPFFETFVLVGNPNPQPAALTFTFLTDGGRTVVRRKTVPANGRLTVNIEGEDPVLANAAVATTIVADQPVIAERAMYWPGPPSTWAEAHNSFGTTTLARKWGLAEGRVGMAHGFQTYILLANPHPLARP